MNCVESEGVGVERPRESLIVGGDTPVGCAHGAHTAQDQLPHQWGLAQPEAKLAPHVNKEGHACATVARLCIRRQEGFGALPPSSHPGAPAASRCAFEHLQDGQPLFLRIVIRSRSDLPFESSRGRRGPAAAASEGWARATRPLQGRRRCRRSIGLAGSCTDSYRDGRRKTSAACGGGPWGGKPDPPSCDIPNVSVAARLLQPVASRHGSSRAAPPRHRSRRQLPPVGQSP